MKKSVCILLCLGLLLGLCSGCGCGENQPPMNIALVCTVANNNPVFDGSIEELSQLSAAPGSTFSLILADGSPEVLCIGEIPDLSDRGYTKAMMKRIYQSIETDLAQQITSAAPDAPEVNVAKALTLGVRELRENERTGCQNLLVVFGSGISTAAPMDMTAVPISTMDISASAAALKEVTLLDATDLDVIWYAIGEVSGQQTPLSEVERERLKEFYEAFFTLCGANSVHFEEYHSPDKCYDFPQSVSVMETQEEPSVLLAAVHDAAALDDTAREMALCAGDVLSFDESALHFAPDSTELIDSAAAKAVLRSVADYALAHPECRLLVCGTTTSAGEEESCRQFAQKRAAVICRLLSEMGVAETQTVPVGCGYSYPAFYTPDRCPDGSLNQSAAAGNRTVKILDASSAMAADILGKGW